MSYLRADLIFPDELLAEIQKYVQDGLIYVPKPKILHKRWGENSGSRETIKQRNIEIKMKFQNAHGIEELAGEYGLSVDTVKRIVYKR